MIRRSQSLLSMSLSFVAAALANSYCAVAQAQDNKPEPWYQVELIVFSQTLDSADAQESWPSDIVLAYPLGTVQLQPTSPEPELEPEPETEGFLVDGPTASGSLYDDQTKPSVETPQTLPFTEVSHSDYSLTAVRNTLDRNNNYRVLRHVAWRQPIFASDETRSVTLTGGDKFGDHYELEGTVALRSSRYLHLQTNLWMTQFYPNYGQQSGYTKWPSLPALPGNSGPGEAANSNSELGYETAWLDTANSNNEFGLGSAFNNTAESSAKPEFIIDNIIHNQQSRKLRTDEIHYIDHPALGIIAKVTTWDPNPEPTLEDVEPTLTP